MTKEKLMGQLEGILDYTRDNMGCQYADEVWGEDETALKQAMEMLKMLYFLFNNFAGKDELNEYQEILKGAGFDAELIEEIAREETK